MTTTNKKTITKTSTKSNTKINKVTTTTGKLDTKVSEHLPVDKSVDNFVEEPKAIRELYANEGKHAHKRLLNTLLEVANILYEEQPSNQGYDKMHLDLFVHAPSHVNQINTKKNIKCNATNGSDINKWAQHMSIILVDELRKAVTRPFFKATE